MRFFLKSGMPVDSPFRDGDQMVVSLNGEQGRVDQMVVSLNGEP